jgi:hypothetical protein
MESNPRPVVDAIYPDKIVIGGVEMREMSLGTWLFLQKINHPFLKIAKIQSGKAKVDISMFDVVSLLFVMSHLPSECAALQRNGKFETAVTEFADQIPAAEIPQLPEAIRVYFSKQFETAIPYGQKKTPAETATGPTK